MSGVKSEVLTVRLRPEERLALERWALAWPELTRGAVIRRLIQEEMDRELERDYGGRRGDLDRFDIPD